MVLKEEIRSAYLRLQRGFVDGISLDRYRITMLRMLWTTPVLGAPIEGQLERKIISR